MTWFVEHGPSLLVFVGGLSAAIGAFWAILRLREPIPPTSKRAVPAGAILLGTVMSLGGVYWSDVRQDRFEKQIVALSQEVSVKSSKVANLSERLVEKADEAQDLYRQLAEKSNEIARLNREVAKSITGGNSFCYLALTLGGGETNTPNIVFVHKGRYPLYDVGVRIVDLEKWGRLGKKLTMQDLRQTDTYINLGNLSRNQVSLKGTLKLPDSGQQRFNIFFSARNGFWNQALRLKRVSGHWRMASKVTRRLNGKTVTVYRKVDSDFPRNEAGQVNWE